MNGPSQSSVTGITQPAPQAQGGLDGEFAQQLILAITNRVQAIVQPVTDRLDAIEEGLANHASGDDPTFGPGVPDDWKNTDPALRNSPGRARKVTILTHASADNPQDYPNLVAGAPFSVVRDGQE